MQMMYRTPGLLRHISVAYGMLRSLQYILQITLLNLEWRLAHNRYDIEVMNIMVLSRLSYCLPFVEDVPKSPWGDYT